MEPSSSLSPPCGLSTCSVEHGSTVSSHRDWGHQDNVFQTARAKQNHTTCDPARKQAAARSPYFICQGQSQRPSQFQGSEEHVGLKILLKPVLENTTCHKSFKLFKSSEQLSNSNAKILFGSLTF